LFPLCRVFSAVFAWSAARADGAHAHLVMTGGGGGGGSGGGGGGSSSSLCRNVAAHFSTALHTLSAHPPSSSLSLNSSMRAPAKSQSPRAAARAAARASAAAAADAAESQAISKLTPDEMLIKGFGIEIGDTDETVRTKGVKKMLVSVPPIPFCFHAV
jgi:hypothetical protein